MDIQLYKYIEAGTNIDLAFTLLGTNKYIDATTGEVSNRTNMQYTDYVDIHNYNTIRYLHLTTTAPQSYTYGMAFYDSNKVYVSGIRTTYHSPAGGEDKIVEVPEGAYYARFSYRTTLDTAFYVKGIVSQPYCQYVGLIDDFNSFWFKRSYTGIGDWELHIAGSSNNANLIKEAEFIKCGNAASGIINKYQETLTNNGKEIIVNGTELKGIAQKRIIIPDVSEAYQEYTNVSPEYVIAQLINKQILNASANRQISGVLESYTESVEVINYSGRFDNVAEEISNLAESYNIGWYADIENNQIIWHIIHGLDRTIEQSANNRLIISTEYENVKEQEYNESLHNTNTLLVAGQGEGIDRTVIMINDDNYGFGRNETYIDARDIDGVEALTQRGNEKLSAYGDAITIKITPETGTLIKEYRSGYDLGDVGTLLDYNTDVRITEIEEVYEEGQQSINFQLGYNKATLSSVLKNITTNRTSSLIKAEGSGSGGGASGRGITYITGSLDDTTGIWTGTSAQIQNYYDGLVICYIPLVGGTSSRNATLNINGLGAKYIYRQGKNITTEYGAGTPLILTFYNDGWRFSDNGENNSLYAVQTYYWQPLTGANIIYRYKFCALDENFQLIPLVIDDKSNIGDDVSANSTPFYPQQIYFSNRSTTIQPNSSYDGGYAYTSYAMSNNNFRYNFSGAYDNYSYLYYKGIYNHNTGLFTLDTTTDYSYFVQLPRESTDLTDYFVNGYYYILVGATGANGNQFHFFQNKPMYYFNGTSLIDGYSAGGKEYIEGGNTTASINAAIQTAGTSCGKVLLSGNITLTGSIVLASNVKVYGNAIITATGLDAITGSNVSNVEIEDITIAACSNGIVISGGTDIKIQNCDITSANNNIKVLGQNTNLRIKNNNLSSGKESILLSEQTTDSTQGIIITGNYLHNVCVNTNNTYYAIYLKGYEDTNHRILNSTISNNIIVNDNGQNKPKYCIYAFYCNGINIYGNTASNMYNNGIDNYYCNELYNIANSFI